MNLEGIQAGNGGSLERLKPKNLFQAPQIRRPQASSDGDQPRVGFTIDELREAVLSLPETRPERVAEVRLKLASAQWETPGAIEGAALRILTSGI